MANLGIYEKQQNVGRGESAYISTLPRNTIAPFEDDRTFLQSYIDAVWVYASVSAIAEAAAQVPFKIFNIRNRDNPVELTYDQQFNVFRFPNTQLSSYRLWEATFSYLRLAGDAFWEVYPNKMKPERIWVLRPDLMEMQTDKRAGVVKYIYWANGKNSAQKPTEFLPEEIVHFHTFNPLDSFQGLSPLNPAKLSIAADLLAQRYNLKFYENGAVPFGLFTSDNVLHESKISMIEEKIIKFLQNSKNWWSPLILHGGLKYQPVSLGPKEIDFAQGRETSRTDQLSAQRATPAVLGLSTANYSEAKEQSKIFRQYRVLPMLRAMQADIDTLFLQHIAPFIRGEFDVQDLPEYREEILENELRLRTEFDRGIITIDEYRKALRMPLNKGKIGEKRFVLSSLSELTEDGVVLAQPQASGNTENPDKIDDDAKMWKLLNEELANLIQG